MEIFTLLLIFLLVVGALSQNITGFHAFKSKTGPDKPNFLCSDVCLIEDQYDRCCACRGRPVWELDASISYIPVFVEYKDMFGGSVLVSNGSTNTFQWLEHVYGMMTGLPENMCGYNDTLVSITVTGNKISNIEGVNCMWHLDTLDLRENPISSISNTTFSGMPNLRVLLLVKTHIQILEPNTFTPADTEIFVTDLSSNEFVSVDVSNVYSKRRAFCNISMSDCILTFTKSNDFNLSTSETYGGGEVLFVDSEIKEQHPFSVIFGDSLETLNHLYKYDTYGRFTYSKLQIPCDCKLAELLNGGIDFYKKFSYMLDNAYICSSPEHMKNVDSTQVFNESSSITIDIFVCQREAFCPKLCTCVEQPSQYRMSVDCSNRNLTSLPSYLPQTVYDIELNCSDNLITNVQSVQYLDQVTVLDLSGNQVGQVSDSVPSSLRKLKRMDLSGHQLTHLSSGFKSLDAGKVWFGENSISCNCDDQWIEVWRKSGKINESNVLMCKTVSGAIQYAEAAFSECFKVETNDTHWLLFILLVTMLLGLIIAKLLWSDFLLIRRHLTRPRIQNTYENDIFILFDEGNSDVIKFVLKLVSFFQEEGFLCFVTQMHGDVGEARDIQLYQNMKNCRSVVAILSLPEANNDVDEVLLGMNHAWRLFLEKRIENIVAVIFDGRFSEQKRRFPYLGSLNRFKRVFKVRSRKYNVKEKIKQALPKPQYKDIALVQSLCSDCMSGSKI